jgi:hypothetical protein
MKEDLHLNDCDRMHLVLDIKDDHKLVDSMENVLVNDHKLSLDLVVVENEF